MKAVWRFWQLPASDRRLLRQAALALLSAGARARFQPRSMFRTLQNQAPAVSTSAEVHDPARIVWAVRTASRYLPGTRTCLIQALAAGTLLWRNGHDARVHIGVTSTETPFRAHAWVVLGDRVILGGEGLDQFSPLNLASTAAPSRDGAFKRSGS